MARLLHEPGAEIDGFRLDAMVHHGGMATLWRVSKPGLDGPMLMKLPHIGEGADPAAIVGFEMELMILPKLDGPHVPKFIASGDWAQQPYIVMEAIAGDSLIERLSNLPLPFDEVARLGVRIAEALDDLHRQHVVHLDVKPSNILFRPDGEAVLIDFGLSHHDRLPDLMQEEFRLPFGTAPYMSPEQLRDVRNEPRSDLFALGVLLYFFSTGERPFGESETLRGMRRRLWRDPVPPRALRADYPPWLQEIVLRCLEVEPARRHPTAAQLAFDLSHPGKVKLTARSEKIERDSFTTEMRRRFNTDLTAPRRAPVRAHLASAPIVAVAVDVGADAAPVNAALLDVTARMLAMLPDARLACLNVLKTNAIALDTTLDAEGHNKQIDRLVRLKAWAAPLKLDERRLTAHVLEGTDPAGSILEFVSANRVDHVLIGARQNSFRRRVLGSVSAKVATEAGCSVTIVRAPRVPDGEAG